MGKAANLNDDQITELAKLPCGVAAVYQNEWIQPVLCKIDRFDSNDGDKVFYTWENKFRDKIKMSDMYLNFFVKNGGTYTRFGERHLQRAYSENEIKRIFTAAGFKKITAFSPLTFDAPKREDMRIVFAAQ